MATTIWILPSPLTTPETPLPVALYTPASLAFQPHSFSSQDHCSCCPDSLEDSSDPQIFVCQSPPHSGLSSNGPLAEISSCPCSSSALPANPNPQVLSPIEPYFVSGHLELLEMITSVCFLCLFPVFLN